MHQKSFTTQYIHNTQYIQYKSNYIHENKAYEINKIKTVMLQL